MAEPGTPTGSAAAESAPKPDTRVLINTHYVKDLSFENPNAPAIFAHREGHQIKVGIDIQTQPLQQRRYEVILAIKAQAELQGQTAFIIDLRFAGLVTVGEGVAETDIEPLLSIEVPRYLFPFARNVIADVSRDGGYPPLLINPVDFAALRNQQRAQSPTTQATGTA
ncbi:MAG: protein-export chaperone SecB [Kiloniellales bacterium]